MAFHGAFQVQIQRVLQAWGRLGISISDMVPEKPTGSRLAAVAKGSPGYHCLQSATACSFLSRGTHRAGGFPPCTENWGHAAALYGTPSPSKESPAKISKNL